MTELTIRGVVSDGGIRLPDDVRLPDGTEVEVRLTDQSALRETEADQRFFEALIEAGLMLRQPELSNSLDMPYEPVRISGEPLSEQIIRERR